MALMTAEGKAKDRTEGSAGNDNWSANLLHDARTLFLLLTSGTGVFELNCKLMYFVLFATYAALEPFLPVILENDCGLTTAEVGLVYCAVPVVGLVCSPLWGIAVDKTGLKKTLWCLAIAVTVLITCCLPLVHGLLSGLAFMFVRAIFYCTIVPMGDHAVMAYLGAERDHEYGRHRLWGAVSWGISSFLTGIALTHLSTVVSIILYAYGGGSLIMLVLFSRLSSEDLSAAIARVTAKDSPEEYIEMAETLIVEVEGSGSLHRDGAAEPIRPGKGTIGPGAAVKDDMDSSDERINTAGTMTVIVSDEEEGVVTGGLAKNRELKAAVIEVFSRPKALVFYLTVLVMGMASRVIYNFLFIFLQEIGGTETLMGLSLVFTVAAEIPFFFVSGALMKRFGVISFLLAAMIGYIIRVTAYSCLHNPWLVLPFETMHGLTFGAMWAAGIQHSTELFPDYGGFAQGLFSGIYTGAGGFLGAFVGGLLYDYLGARVMYRVMATAVAVNLLFVVIFHREELVTVIKRNWGDLREWRDKKSREANALPVAAEGDIPVVCD